MSEELPEKHRYTTEVGYGEQGDVNLLEMYLHKYDREQTRRAYRNDLEQFFGKAYLTVRDVRAATFVHVNEYLRQLEEDGLKASTLKRKVSCIRGFFDWLEALEIVDRNPANKELLRSIRKSNGRDRKIVFLSDDEAKKLVDATRHAGEAAQRDRALILTLLHCVLRRSEAAAMDVEHIRPLGRYWILDLPQAKGGSDQFVKMPDQVVEEIERHQDQYGIRQGPLWRSLSNNNYGERLSPAAIYEMVKRTARRAGLPDNVGAHTLRHTGCTLAIESGATVQQVKTHARHKNLETTMIYVHQREKLRDSAADFIDLDS